jgi:hypothetical protein
MNTPTLDVDLGGKLAALTATESAALREEIRETVRRFLARRAQSEVSNMDRAQLQALGAREVSDGR